jgi:hypothetical protein
VRERFEARVKGVERPLALVRAVVAGAPGRETGIELTAAPQAPLAG